MLRLLSASLLVTLSAASFCGDSTIPYSVEILPNGQPILGCARPTCFGWAPSGNPASNTGSFYKINDHADGFVRTGRAFIPAFGPTDPRFYRPQTAMCDAFFSSTCAGVNQWVGGIAPQLNVTAAPTALQCCAFDGLLTSEDRGQATLHGGQIVVGGEVLSSGLQVAFDYISDVVKRIEADGTTQYDVSIRRMQCAGVPESADNNNKVEAGAAAQAFQAPNVEVEQPLALPAGPEGPAGPVNPAGNAVLEELVQEEAVQLPAGTQFQPAQPALQPPPFQPQPVPQQAFQAFQPQFVPQVQYSAPAYYGPSGGNNQWCFTADMTVKLMDGTTKRMDELKKQDWVLAATEKELEYVPVEFWLHRVPAQEAEFNEFETEDGKTIKLTDKHYIFKGDCSRVNAGEVAATSLPAEAVFADQVHAGDCLFTVEDNLKMHEVRVVRANKVKQTGIYAPMTSNGRIFVNGIHASCHNIMQDNTVGQTVFETANKIYNKFFGSSSEEIVEANDFRTPSALNTLLAMAEVIIPKHLLEL